MLNFIHFKLSKFYSLCILQMEGFNSNKIKYSKYPVEKQINYTNNSRIKFSMDRTSEYRSHQKENKKEGETDSNLQTEDSTHSFLSIARDLRSSLAECYLALKDKRTNVTGEMEESIKSLSEESVKIVSLLNRLENRTEFIDAVVVNLSAAVKRTELKLEDRKSKRLNKPVSLSLVLEPEKAKVSPKGRGEPKGVMMQVLQEENVKILEKVQSREREMIQIRRRISEIDTLQKLITQELFIQDERIDVVINNATAASVDVKISRAYIKNAGEKKKVAKRFISLFIMILSIVLLILYYSNK